MRKPREKKVREREPESAPPPHGSCQWSDALASRDTAARWAHSPIPGRLTTITCLIRSLKRRIWVNGRGKAGRHILDLSSLQHSGTITCCIRQSNGGPTQGAGHGDREGLRRGFGADRGERQGGVRTQHLRRAARLRRDLSGKCHLRIAVRRGGQPVRRRRCGGEGGVPRRVRGGKPPSIPPCQNTSGMHLRSSSATSP